MFISFLIVPEKCSRLMYICDDVSVMPSKGEDRNVAQFLQLLPFPPSTPNSLIQIGLSLLGLRWGLELGSV